MRPLDRELGDNMASLGYLLLGTGNQSSRHGICAIRPEHETILIQDEYCLFLFWSKKQH